MFYVSQPLGAVFAYDGDEHFHLIGMAIDADGVITITKGVDDLTLSKADYAPYYSMESDEIIAKFAITPTTPMLPKSLVLDVPEEVEVPLDMTTTGAEMTTVIDIIALTGGTFGVTLTSSDEEVVTAIESSGTITFTPVGEGAATVTILVEDSESVYGDSTFIMNIDVVKRPLVFKAIDDVLTTAGHAKIDIALEAYRYDNVLTSVEAWSTDNEIVAVSYADDATNAIVGTISITPHATQLGEVTVFIRGVDADSTVDETIISFTVRVTAA